MEAMSFSGSPQIANSYDSDFVVLEALRFFFGQAVRLPIKPIRMGDPNQSEVLDAAATGI